jgi:hypothetical protein
LTRWAFRLARHLTLAEGVAVASKDWTAIHDHMHPPKKLTVRGTVIVETSNSTAELKPEEPQKSNPLDYRLEVVVHPSTKPDLKIPTPVLVEYEEVTDVEYETVSIVPDGPTGLTVEHPE